MQHTSPVRLGDRLFDPVANTVSDPGGAPVKLTPREGAVLTYLLQHQDRPVPLQELHDRVWGHGPRVISRAGYHTIRRLRAKLERDPDHPELLLNLHGEGYRLVLSPRLAPARGFPAFEGGWVGEPQLGRAPPAGWTTLSGPPGVGKTRQAAEWTSGQRVVFCDVGAVRTPMELVRAVAASAELPLVDATDVHVLLEQIERALAHDLPWLVLDGAESCGPAVVDALDRWESHGVRILATSRRPLGGRREQVHWVPPLSHDLAVTLFRDRASRMAPLTDDARIVDQIVDALDGIPLAIEVVARQTVLRSGVSLLRDLRGRQAGDPLAAAFGDCADHLGEDARRGLALLSTCPEGFGLPLAARLLGVSDVEAEKLVRDAIHGGLVCRLTTSDPSRFRVLSPLRSALCADVPVSSEPLARAIAALPDDVAGRRAELSAFLAAFDWFEAHEAGAVPSLLLSWRDAVEDRLPLEMAIALAERALACGPPAPEGVILSAWASKLHDRAGELDRARRALAEAERWARDTTDAGARFELSRQRADVLLTEGRFREARMRIEQLLDAPSASDPARRVDLLNLLGLAYKGTGCIDRAEALFAESVRLARRVGASRAHIKALHNLASVESRQGRVAAAFAHYREALALTPDRSAGVAPLLHDLGVTHLRAGDLAAAAEAFERATATASQMGLTLLQAKTAHNLGALLLLRREPDRAARLVEDALPTFERARCSSDAALAQSLLAQCRLAAGDPMGARSSVQAALAFFEREDTSRIADCLAIDALALLRLGADPTEPLERLLAGPWRAPELDELCRIALAIYHGGDRASLRQRLDALEATVQPMVVGLRVYSSVLREHLETG